MARGFTLVEVAVVVGTAAVGVALAGPIVVKLSPEAKRAVSLRNMETIGAAGGAYRLDHDGYLPITMTNRPRASSATIGGWCNWSAGGKNNDKYWLSSSGGTYDVEAADRPLNPYAMPGVEFYAPPAPGQLPPNHPARLGEQAPVFRDPSDEWSHQRHWPAANQFKQSAYDDVGTSYFWNGLWMQQLRLFPGDIAKMNEGARRIATGQGAPPARFVWMFDEPGDLVHVSGPTTRPVLMSFVDGHAAWQDVTRRQYITPNYSMVFEDLPPPGG